MINWWYCDAPGFHPGSLTLTIGSTELTWSNDGQPGPSPRKHHQPPLVTHFGQPLVKFGQNPSQTPLKPLWRSCVAENFCRVLQISPKHFKFSQCKSCVVCWETQLSCWVAFEIWSGNEWKMQVNASGYYSQAPRKSASWHAFCAKMVEQNTIHPL
jgi:hypothetical protein